MKNLKGRKLNKKEQKAINGGAVNCAHITCPPDYYCGQRGCTLIGLGEPGDPDPNPNPGSGSSNGGGGGGTPDGNVITVIQ